MEKQELNRILEKFAAGSVDPAEQIAFNQWLATADETEYLDVLDQYQAILQHHPVHEKANPDLLNKIKGHINTHERKDRIRSLKDNYLPFIAAAIALLVLSTILFLNSNKNPESSVENFSRNYPKKIVSPGGNKAILTLADGSKINLDDLANGEIAKQSDITITKASDGRLVYSSDNPKGLDQNSALKFNTINTPKGGQYQVNLADGTKVWLNAASSLRYPTVFKGKERKVILVGEAYFEVAKNHTMPFRVVSDHQLIEVLGTHFNINCYLEEDLTKTTLLEGSIKVTAMHDFSPKPIKAVVLKPGQQSQIAPKGSEIINVINVGNEAAAWKNGYFNFNHEDIQSIMRIISRWYDVEVEYKGTISKGKFGGSISRFKNVSEVLDALQLTGDVHFNIEGRRITVLP